MMEFTKHRADFGRGLASWYESDGGDEEISFLSANGFPVGSYRFMLDEFGREPFHKHYRITSLENRGAWPGQPLPGKGYGWAGHADDLIAFLDYRRECGESSPPVLGVGHSIGATVSLLAAVKRPDLFKGLVLIDPASLPGTLLPLLGRFRSAVMKRSGLVKSTRNRRPSWQSRDAFAEYHGAKSVYRKFRPAALADYAEAGLIPGQEGQFALRYSRDWEAWNFQHTPAIWPALRQVTCPTIVLRAEFSSLHPEAEFRRRTRSLPAHVKTRDIKGVGHMALQENPALASRMIHDALEEILAASSAGG